MKHRPRKIEREVAEHLSRFFVSRGWAPVRRIPVLGRTGPDIEINESGFVIDVKSRKEIPVTALVKKGQIGDYGNGLMAVRLDEIEKLYTDELPNVTLSTSKKVTRYWEHMDEWRREHCPEGITLIILHRPGRHVHTSTAVFHSEQRSVLNGKTTI